MKRESFRIRDPFVLPDPGSGRYYVYGTTDMNSRYGTLPVFSVYVTRDLEEFEGPYPVFDGKAAGFWAERDYWAAEVHLYRGKYYLFGSFCSDKHRRASQILVSESPMGPFQPISELPQTPEEWECLDGTLWVENGRPYLVFCREWLQCVVGEVWAVELTEDLRERAGKPFLLFRADDCAFVGAPPDSANPACRVTDGPFLYRENGKLRMLWSSFVDGKYTLLYSEAENLHGMWRHFRPSLPFEGGHAMLFRDFEGNRRLSLHSPNAGGMERAHFLPFPEQDG